MNNKTEISFDLPIKTTTNGIDLNKCNYMVIVRGDLDAFSNMTKYQNVPIFSESCVRAIVLNNASLLRNSTPIGIATCNTTKNI